MNYIYFLVFLLIHFSTNSENMIIFDLQSEEFDETREITDDNVFFPMQLLYGQNDSDFVTVGGANSSITQNYTIKILHFASNVYFGYYDMAIILVIEVLKERPDEICYFENSIFIEFEKSINLLPICDKLVFNDKVYGKYVKVFSDSRLLVHLNVKNFRGTIKITATATRSLNSEHKICNKYSEFSCKISGKTWCLNKNLECNGELNCGDREQTDENPEYCHGYSKELMVMALYGMIMLIVLLFILTQVLRICLYRTPHLPRLSRLGTDNALLLDLESQSRPPPQPQYSETFTKRNLEMINRINAAKSSTEHLPPNNLEKKIRQKFF